MFEEEFVHFSGESARTNVQVPAKDVRNFIEDTRTINEGECQEAATFRKSEIVRTEGKREGGRDD